MNQKSSSVHLSSAGNPLRKKFVAALDADDEMEDVTEGEEVDEEKELAKEMAAEQAKLRKAEAKQKKEMEESLNLCFMKQ